jgi:hypothetical protein
MASLKTIDGIPVVDAKHPLELHITKTDCDKADVKVPSRCAAALAIRREHKPVDVRVHLSRVYVRQNKGNWQRYMTSKPLRTEIIAFDRGGQFEPGQYDLAPPPPSRKPTGKTQGSKKKPGWKPSGNKRRPYTRVANVRGGPA